MNKIIIIILISYTSLFISCSKNKKFEGNPFYIEVEQMDEKIESCFEEKLFGKWASLHETYPHPITEPPGTQKNVWVFRSYNEFDVDKDPPGTNKLMVRVYGDGDTSSTFFQVQGFRWEKEGIWQRFINLGNFRIPDRQNDKKNPGKVDDEEICDYLVKICILSAFKGGVEEE